jgi:formate hydrogenlyase subunit 3/multisubunit Na+/H+ antiporter MnhD subunit
MPDWMSYRLPALLFMLTGYAIGAILPMLLSIVWRKSLKSGMALKKAVKNIGFTIALLSSLAGCLFSLSVLISGKSLDVEIQETLLFGTIAFHADGLSAFFVGIIALLGVSVSVYSLGYATEFLERRNPGLLVFLYNAFLLSMASVILAGHAVLFVFAWEAMSLTTYFLKIGRAHV